MNNEWDHEGHILTYTDDDCKTHAAVVSSTDASIITVVDSSVTARYMRHVYKNESTAPYKTCHPDLLEQFTSEILRIQSHPHLSMFPQPLRRALAKFFHASIDVLPRQERKTWINSWDPVVIKHQ